MVILEQHQQDHVDYVILDVRHVKVQPIQIVLFVVMEDLII